MAEPTKTPVQQEAERKQREEEAKKHAEEQRKKDEAERQKNQQKPGQPGQSGADKRAAGGAVVGGAMTTYGTPNPAAMETPKPVFLKHDEIKGLVGDIGPGEIGHIELDEEGNPTGAAFRDIPGPDDVTAAVYGNPAVQFDDLVTPSGAPITKMMNPEPKLWDAGMLARNPPPEPTERQRKFQHPGGGVANQPVTV